MSRTTDIEAAAELGSRVRSLRREVGMTQVELAGGRFSKQYVSQIERGETPPSPELVAWLAERLGVDPELLETGLSSSDRRRTRDDLESGDELLAAHRYAEALELFRGLRLALGPDAPPWACQGAVRGEVWALIRLGRLEEAGDLLEEAHARLGRRPGSGGSAELAYLTAVCRYMSSDVSAAHDAFGRALLLLDESEDGNDALRSDIHQWRSRCYRRQRDWEAAREDIERALELCAALDDNRRSAEVSLQASLVAERQGRWVLARRYATTARDLFQAVGDTVTVGRVLNNLAGLNHLLEDDVTAIAQLQEAFAIFVQAHLEAEAGYVLSSLAEIHRERDELELAGVAARRALVLLEGRADHLQEVGTAQLVLARTHLARGELDQAEDMLAAVDRSYETSESISLQARSWMARGELELLRENDEEAARLYRQAATSLQPADTWS